ncbi:sodium/calcium exchanger 1-like, partial [Tropilaelaps mercedesae]
MADDSIECRLGQTPEGGLNADPKNMNTSGGPDRPRGRARNLGRASLPCKFSPVLVYLTILVCAMAACSASGVPPAKEDSNEVRIAYNPSVFSTVFAGVPYVKATPDATDKETSKESSATSEDYESADGYPSGFWTYLLRPGFAFQSDSQLTEATKNGTPVEKGKCKNGLILPVWSPVEPLSMGDRWARGLVYFLGLCYFFVGISIIADRFMAAIEVITSLE